MHTVVLVIHLMLAAAIVGLVLIQRSEGGGLGIGGGGGGIGSLTSAAGAADLLTRATAICGALFFVTSLTLAVLANERPQAGALLESVDNARPVIEAPVQAGDNNEDSKAADPAEQAGDSESAKPSVPISD